MTGTSDEHKQWRTDVDRNLGEINANIQTILSNQKSQITLCNQRFGDVDGRVKIMETSSVAEVAVKKWKERMIGFFMTLIGMVVGIIGKVLFDK